MRLRLRPTPPPPPLDGAIFYAIQREDFDTWDDSPVICGQVLDVSIPRAGKGAAHVRVVGHFGLRWFAGFRAFPVRSRCRQPRVLLVAHVTFKSIQVVGFSHVIDPPLPAFQGVQQTSVCNPSGILKVQILSVLIIVLVKTFEEFSEGLWRGEVIHHDDRVVVRHPVCRHRRPPIDGHAALMERPPQLLCHVIQAQAILQRQVELVASDKIHKYLLFARSCGRVLQIPW